MASKSSAPRVRDLDDLKATPRTPTLIWMPRAQFEESLRGARVLDEILKRPPHGAVSYTPDPNGDVVIGPVCQPTGPNQVCMAKMRPTRDGGFAYECHCRPTRDRTTPERGPTPPPCSLAFYPGQGIRCDNNSCAGSCRLVIRLVRTSIRAGRAAVPAVVIACECQ